MHFMIKKPKQEEKEQRKWWWIGKTCVARLTEETMMRVGTQGPWSAPHVVKSSGVSGTITNIGEKSIQIEGVWYELDETKPGGIRIVEVLN